ENFDREFVGPIRACDALARSRNLPAVELASRLRHPTLYEFLRGAGVKLPRSEALYGLTLPLGGAEVTMEDLVRLYAALANNGELRPLRRTSRDPVALRGRRIIMPEAAFLTPEMLNQPRPEPNQLHVAPPGANLKRVSFCAVSGDLPEPYCTQQVEGWFIPGISPIKLCDVHQEVLVDAASGLRVARDDGTRQLRREVYEFWPTELLSIFRRAGVPRKLPPPFLPDTDPELVARTGNPPRIIAPAAGSTYELLNSESSRKQGIPLRAKTDADVREVYWFADKGFIGKSAATD